MKARAIKLANGKVQLTLTDNGNGRVVMKFDDVKGMAKLSDVIMEEAKRLQVQESQFRANEQLRLFQ